MQQRWLAAVVATITVGGCMNMEPIDFKDASPRLLIEDYFAGETRAWGIFEDRFGNLRRQFTVTIQGTWQDGTLMLDEHFEYRDGERDRRVWRIRKTGEHSYEGTADDVIGIAKGEARGNALNWRYDMDLKIGDSRLRVHFNDWMYLQPSGVLLNRAHVTKWGVEIGTVTLAFSKTADALADAAPALTVWPDGALARQAASR